MIKIKSYVISPKGYKLGIVTLPMVWRRDLGLSVGDRLDFYRDNRDRLIIIASKSSNTSVQPNKGAV